jgi:predicted nucleic acid-binding protein
MIVVSNTSPLNYLALIELAYLLEQLFGRLLIPEAVLEELQARGAPEAVRRFLESKPGWLEVRPAGNVSTDLLRLDAGEREAIALAGTVRADLILLDERRARVTARDLGLQVAGTLGVLDQAARRGLVVLDVAIERLAKTNFRVRPGLISGLIR